MRRRVVDGRKCCVSHALPRLHPMHAPANIASLVGVSKVANASCANQLPRTIWNFIVVAGGATRSITVTRRSAASHTQCMSFSCVQLAARGLLCGAKRATPLQSWRRASVNHAIRRVCLAPTVIVLHRNARSLGRIVR